MEAEELHAYDRPARVIGLGEPTLMDTLLTAAQTWATLHPAASGEVREYLAALVRVELLGGTDIRPRAEP